MRSGLSRSDTRRFTTGLEGVYFLEVEIPGSGDPVKVTIKIDEQRDLTTPYSLAALGSLWDYTSSMKVYYININQTYAPTPIQIKLTPVSSYF